MEIPYIVTPRKDTGLFNSKIAIWLFLASEVMLFGGFFSAYIFLRLGADYPWPERTLPVLPGLINTFVLIFSSVTVVFAWAALKMRQWGRFQIFMSITIACSGIFMVLKGIEYNVKFHHQAVRLQDYTVVEGHLGYKLKEGVKLEHGVEPADEQLAKDAKGKKIEENLVNFEVSEFTFNTLRHEPSWVEKIMARAAEKNAAITLAANLDLLRSRRPTSPPARTTGPSAPTTSASNGPRPTPRIPIKPIGRSPTRWLWIPPPSPAN
jgi:hypothetical protein